LGIGDWGLGIGDWAQSPIPNPQLKELFEFYAIKFYNFKKIIIRNYKLLNFIFF
jgi:hypothetical protein